MKNPMLCRALLTAVLVFFVFFNSLFAQDAPVEADESAVQADQSVYRYFDVAPGLRLWGVQSDFNLGMRFFPGLDSGLWTKVGAAWETVGYYQDAAGTSPLAMEGAGLSTDGITYSRWDIKGGVGIFQGLHFNEKKDRNDLSLMGAWLYQYDIIDPALTATDWIGSSSGQITDRGGLSYFLLDLVYDGTNRETVSKNKSGVYTEAYGEYSPSGFYSADGSTWARAGALFKAFVPLFETTTQGSSFSFEKFDFVQDKLNQFSAYLAFQVLADQLFPLNEEPLPTQISYTSGGINYRYGIGGMVRGYADGYFYGTTKAQASAEFRLVGPAIFQRDFMPILVAYVEGGLAYSEIQGVQGGMGTGIGILMELFDLAELGLYTEWNLIQPNEQGSYWTPLAVGFGFQF